MRVRLYIELDDKCATLLANRAKEEGVTIEDFALNSIIQTLENTSSVDRQLMEIRATLQQVNYVVRNELIKDVENFRSDFSLAVLALLVGGGQLDRDTARIWVAENLYPKP